MKWKNESLKKMKVLEPTEEMVQVAESDVPSYRKYAL